MRLGQEVENIHTGELEVITKIMRVGGDMEADTIYTLSDSGRCNSSLFHEHFRKHDRRRRLIHPALNGIKLNESGIKRMAEAVRKSGIELGGTLFHEHFRKVECD